MEKRAFANSSTGEMKRENRRICATRVKVKVGRTNTFTQIVHRRRISTELNAEELLLRGRRIREGPDDDRLLTADA